MKNSIFREAEPPFSKTLKSLTEVADSDFGLLKNLGRVFQYYDEPKPWQYTASVNNKFAKNDGKEFTSIASGISFFSEKYAILKCLSEGIERYCNFAFLKTSIKTTNSYKSLKTNALDPMSVASFSKKQLKSKHLKNYQTDKDSIFSWTDGESLTTSKSILLPAQLIYLSYLRPNNEPSIHPSISTGCAGGACLSAALVRGICEVIERDAFMIFYLNKLPAPRVQLGLIKDKKIKSLLKTIDRYKMEVCSFDLTTDIPVPTYLSIVINRSGIGKAVSIGMKCGLSPLSALAGSIEETFNTRTWIRTEYDNTHEKVTAKTLLNKSDIKTRGFLWYPKSAIKHLDFLLSSQKVAAEIPTDISIRSSGEQLRILISLFKKLGLEVVYKDITHPIFKKMNYFVVKVIIPKALPFHLNESTKLLGGDRLYNVPQSLGYHLSKNKKLNDFPHPFL